MLMEPESDNNRSPSINITKLETLIITFLEIRMFRCTFDLRTNWFTCAVVNFHKITATFNNEPFNIQIDDDLK